MYAAPDFGWISTGASNPTILSSRIHLLIAGSQRKPALTSFTLRSLVAHARVLRLRPCAQRAALELDEQRDGPTLRFILQSIVTSRTVETKRSDLVAVFGHTSWTQCARQLTRLI